MIRLLSESGDYVKQSSEDGSLGNKHCWYRVEVRQLSEEGRRNRGVNGQESNVCQGRGNLKVFLKFPNAAQSDTESPRILKFQQSEDIVSGELNFEVLTRWQMVRKWC